VLAQVPDVQVLTAMSGPRIRFDGAAVIARGLLRGDMNQGHARGRLHDPRQPGDPQHDRTLEPPAVGKEGPHEVLLAESLRKLDLDLTRLGFAPTWHGMSNVDSVRVMGRSGEPEGDWRSGDCRFRAYRRA
jgi:hypothetical protein